MAAGLLAKPPGWVCCSANPLHGLQWGTAPAPCRQASPETQSNLHFRDLLVVKLMKPKTPQGHGRLLEERQG
ncbi:MAG: hypothetical protein VW687_10050, partial [Curvibacter sp.]